MKKYIFVDSAALPDYFVKVLATKKLLEENSSLSVTDAARANGISRSTYYKYKDSVFDAQPSSDPRRATFMLSLNHEPGALSNVLSLFSSLGVNVLTISQSLPVNDTASVMMSVDMRTSSVSAEEMLHRAVSIRGLKQIQLLSMS